MAKTPEQLLQEVQGRYSTSSNTKPTTYLSPEELRKKVTASKQYDGFFRKENIDKAKAIGGAVLDYGKEEGKKFLQKTGDDFKAVGTGEVKVKDVIKEVPNATKNVFKGIGKFALDVGKGIIGGGVRLVNTGTRAVGLDGYRTPEAIEREKKFFGYELSPLQDTAKKAKKFAEEQGATDTEAKSIATGAFIGSVFLENPFTGGVGGTVKKIGKKALKELAEETSEQVIKQTLKNSGVADDVIKVIAKDIAKAQDQKAVAEIIERGVKSVSPKTIVKTADNQVAEISAQARNSLENDTTGVRSKSVQFFKDNPDEITKNPIRLREIEDGQIVIEDGRHRLNAARELGIRNIDVEDVTPNYTKKPSKTIQELAQSVDDITETATKKADDVIAARKAVVEPNTLDDKLDEIIDTVNPSSGVFTDYTPQKRATAKLADNITTLDKTAGKSADELVTIYRGAPDTQKGIVAGDFVTTNKQLAQDYAGTGKVLSREVKMSELLDDITEPLGEEYIFRPSRARQVVDSVPTNVGKEKVIVRNYPEFKKFAANFKTGDELVAAMKDENVQFGTNIDEARALAQSFEKQVGTRPTDAKAMQKFLDLQKSKKVTRETAKKDVEEVVDNVTGKVTKEKPKSPIRTATRSPEATKEAAEKTNLEVSGIKPDGTHQASELVGVKPIKQTAKKASEYAQKKVKNLEVEPETRFRYIMRGLIDKFDRLKTIQTKITGKKGLPLSEEKDAYLQQILFTGRTKERLEVFEDAIVGISGKKSAKEALLPRMEKAGVSIDEMGEYLHARHAVERNARVAKINPDLPDGGSGMTNAEAKAILEKYAPRQAEFDKYAKEIDEKVIKPRIEALVESGIYNRETAEKITKEFDHYVPLNVDEEAFDVPLSAGRGFDVRGKDIKRLKGSTKNRVNPLVQAIANYENTIIRAEKNKVGKTLKKLVEDNPNKDLWEVSAQKYLPEYGKDGEVRFMKPAGMKLDDNVVQVFDDGKVYHVTLHDKALVDGMKNLGTERGIKVLHTINNYLRSVITFYNPEFLVTNFERDIQTALINIGGEQGGKVAKDVLLDTRKAIVGIMRETRGRKAGKRLQEKFEKGAVNWAQEYKELKAEGGTVGWFDQKSISDKTKQINKRLARIQGKTKFDRLMQKVDGVGELVSNVNESVESGVRLSYYVNLKKAGVPKARAAAMAKDLTVNFNQKGRWGTALNSLYLFANAGLQGSTRIIRALKHKRTRKIVAGVAAFSYGVAEMNRQVNPEEYDKIPDWEKDTNLIFMLPKGFNPPRSLTDKDGNMIAIAGTQKDGYYFKIKLPYGYNVFHSLGSTASDITHGEKNVGQATKRLFSAIGDSFNPLGSGTFLQTISPTVLDPAVQIAENKNFAGSPIAPEQSQYGNRVPQSSLYFKSARKQSVAVAKWLSELTGGNAVEEGAIEVSPEHIDHIVDFLGGGVGKFLSNVADNGLTLAKGDMPEVENMPFVRKFVGKTYENVERSLMYEILDKSETNKLSQKEIQDFATYNFEAFVEGQIDAKKAKETLKKVVQNQNKVQAARALKAFQNAKTNQEKLDAAKDLNPQQVEEFKKLLKEEVERLNAN